MTSGYTIREGLPADDPIFVRFFQAMWFEMGFVSADFSPSYEQRFGDVLASLREQRTMRWFVAESANEPIGSAGGRLLEAYPGIFKAGVRGYIFGVYVLPAHRRRGVARALTQAVIGYLRAAGCAKIRLHASEFGRPVYEAMGFVPTNEMELRSEHHE